MSAGHTQTGVVTTHDNRSLALEISGSLTGFPIFLLHGTPGSRSGPKPRSSLLYRLGVRLISYDRPGYGGSTRVEGRSVADAASDVEAIANELRIDRFAVVGRSGGGPHALACAALLTGRVSTLAGLVSLARHDAKDLDWFGGMTNDNNRAYTDVSENPLALMERLRLRTERTIRDPHSMVTHLLAQMTAADRRIVDEVTMRQILTATYSEAVKHGPYGWIDDVFALRGDWGFSLDAIQIPVRLWHGGQDNFAPASHTLWLGHKIPMAEVTVEPGTAHFGAVEILPQVLAWSVAHSMG